MGGGNIMFRTPCFGSLHVVLVSSAAVSSLCGEKEEESVHVWMHLNEISGAATFKSRD